MKAKVNRFLTFFNIGLLLFYLIIFNGKGSDLSSLQSNLLSASSILTGIIITYLFAKIFQIKTEREARKIEIDKLSQKLTSFRKLIHYILNSHTFWPGDDIRRFKQEYPGLTYNDVYSNNSSELAQKYTLADPLPFSQAKSTLYMAMMELMDNDDNPGIWPHNPIAKFYYTMQQLENYYYPSNALWYWLVNERIKWPEDVEIHDRDKSRILERAIEIDPKYIGRKVDRNLLGDLGSDFHNIYLPQLMELTRKNSQELSKTFWRIFNTLILIMGFGVLCPLILLASHLNPDLNYYLMNIATVTVIVSLLNLLWDFKTLIREETSIH